MHTERHPVPSRPIGAILAARRREKAALAARCRSFGMIAEAMAHYGRTPTGAPDHARWEQLGDHAGTAASADPAGLLAALEDARRMLGGERPHERHGAPARHRARTPAGAAP